MATRNETHVHDLSTLANFSDWSQAIGKALAAFGWVQSSDTGQVVWAATYAVTAATRSGSNTTYAYNLSSNFPPRVGINVTITGMTNSGNNVTNQPITAVNYAAGTFTIANASGVTETGSSGSGVVQSAQSSVPTSGNYVFEIWQPGDALTTFYLRIDYGNSGGSSPSLKFNIGTTTGGSGTLTGTVMTQMIPNVATNNGSTLYNCLFCGDSSSFSMMLWREGTANVGFAVDRSRDSSFNATSTYVSMWCTRQSGGGIGNTGPAQQSTMFGVGTTGMQGQNDWSLESFSWVTVGGIGQNLTGGSGATSLFNGTYPILPIFPCVGYLDVPTLAFAHVVASDFTELATLTATVFGSTHTFIFSKLGNYLMGQNSLIGLLMRWE